MKRILYIHNNFDGTGSMHSAPNPGVSNCWDAHASANMPNPASVYCEQNGNKLEIHTAADGSQSGVCVFPDGSTCDEWAYFRGECGLATQISPTPTMSDEATQKASNDGAGENASGGYMPPGTTEEISDWWGVIKSTPPGAQYDDYFERQDLGRCNLLRY